MDTRKTKIGKDIIECLTLGMYEDPRFVYREYIQNSADQIDKAIESGLLSSMKESRIEISIFPESASISIYDNATGIRSDDVEAILKNIAKSTKDRAKDKGFRGIGRLGGLAYCEKLIFETSHKGEKIKTFLFWDANKLKSIINNRAEKEDAAVVIDDITDKKIEPEENEKHYFKVTLEGITNKQLLDSAEIIDYLSMVAPVPFSKGFCFNTLIHEKAANLNVNIDEYPIYVNNDQVRKAYTTTIYDGDTHLNKRKIDEVKNIEFFEIRYKNNLLIAWGWYGLSALKKQMNKINTARGIRLRKGNIQIGMEDALAKHFKENRGSNYYFGEVYAVSPNLIPNSQRNYFIENDILVYFEKQVKLKFIELNGLYRLSSSIRNEQKKIDEYNKSVNEYKDKAEKGSFSTKEEKNRLEKSIEEKKKKAENAKIKIEKYTKDQRKSKDEKKIIELVTSEKKDISLPPIVIKSKKEYFWSTKLSSYGNKERKVIEKIFHVINNCLPKELAETVIHKIEEELTKK